MSSVAEPRYLSSPKSFPSTFGENEYSGKDDHYVPEKAPPAVQPRALTSRKLHPAFDTMRWVCAISHIGLIILLASFAVRQPDKGDPSIISIGSPVFNITDDLDANIGQTIQSGVKIGFGWIVTGWTILLTLATQKLALRRQLKLRNTLTAKHDANEAWMGLGSSLMAVLRWRQLEFREARNSIFIPLLYLAGIASLHSVGTSMFGLVPKSVTRPFSFSSQGLPDFTATARNAFSGPSALLTMLSLSNLNFPGLASDGVGVIYDIPVDVSQFPESIREVNVMATHFNVSCGSLSGSVQNVNGDGPAFFFEPGFGLESTFLSGFDTFPNTISQHSLAIRPAPWGPAWVDYQVADVSSWPSSILIFTTVPVFDSSNRTVKPVPVNPPMTYVPQTQAISSSTSQVTALACNLTVDALPYNVTIDPVSNALLSSIDQTNKTSANLSPFPTMLRTTPFDAVNSPEDALTAFWGLLPIASVSPLFSQISNLCTEQNNSAEVCGTLYETEQFVMESLNIFPDLLLPANSNNVNSIDLAELENVLSRMTAIEIWAEAQGNNLKFANAIFSSEGAPVSKTFVTHNNSMEYAQIVWVFAFNRIQLFGVIIIVVVLLLLATPSLLDNSSLKIDSIGILQMIWLANNHPELQQSITELDDPSTDELRKAGMRIKRDFRSSRVEDLPQQPC
ncbi:hypothetical protein DFJ43DRAFT_1098865 [Lentinula guzmanii]|uniref:Transmembrane protein n=1 Tax=Lentinula guzmanii TaxID=2804957 RepID=A0AA38JBJ2_9AGAR|nr:hypothetical protein DFJ43DRAFT_1098865 [Lentinula guzmanii]